MIGLYELKYSLGALLANPQRAKQIAEAARARAMSDHTYAKRAQELLRCCGFAASANSAFKEIDL